MTRMATLTLDRGLRQGSLAGVAALALGLASPAMAQQAGGTGQGAQAQPSTAPSQQPGSQQPPVVGQLRTAEQAIRQAQGQISGGQQPNWPQARTAVEAGLNVIGRVPQQMQGQDTWRTAQRELNEAQQALQGGQPNGQQAATQMREAADALDTLASRMGGSADAQGGMSSDQRSGTSAAPAPAQSGGSRPQQAAVTSGVALQSVQSLVGKNVVGSNGREAGEIQNLLIDNAGRVRAAVVEWGGFLGIGERQALVPIERIQLGQNDNDRARLNMTREELEALPHYDRDRVADYGRQQGWGDGLRLYR